MVNCRRGGYHNFFIIRRRKRTYDLKCRKCGKKVRGKL